MNGLQVQERLPVSTGGFPSSSSTAHEDVGARERALKAGAVAFMRKPFSDDLFIDTLRAAMRGGPGAAP